MKKSYRAACAAAMVLLWGEVDAVAFSAPGHRWFVDANTPVTYALDPVGSDDVTDGSDLVAIRHAFATWEAVSCAYLTFQEESFVSPATIGNDGYHRIFWVEDEASWPGDAATLALTYTFYTLDANRRITDADIAVNGANWRFTTTDAQVGQGTPPRVDLETVLFHEIGHFFGLDHSTDTTAAMYPSNNKLIQRTPATDDLQGICSLYGNGMSVPGTVAGAATVGSPCDNGTDCADDICVADDLVERTYCSKQCVLGQSESCPSGYPCTFAGSYGALCLVPPPVDELCDMCTNETHCSGGLCVKIPGVNAERSFCSKPCDPTPGQASGCPTGFACATGSVGATVLSACVPTSGVCDPAGKGGFNEICYANETCKAGFACLPLPGGAAAFCYPLCEASAVGAACSTDRSVCLPAADRDNVNACFTIARAGEPCIPEECDSDSFCAYDETEGLDSAICYRKCDVSADQCRANEQCKAYEGFTTRLCEPSVGFKYLGQSCVDSSECQSGLCSVYRSARLCTTPCATTNADACAAGLRCIPETGSTQGLCWPESFTDPNASEDSRTVSADNSAAYCVCDATSRCDPDCDCDPECGAGCSCRAVHTSSGAELAAGDDHGASSSMPSVGWALFAALASVATWRVRRVLRVRA
ncbi:MAG: matrixin family metalloprotease [Deltaproteobacteria bacterium]|nr:matrixin family metalloprotease [Deltaproteobacteria bacterium]